METKKPRILNNYQPFSNVNFKIYQKSSPSTIDIDTLEIAKINQHQVRFSFNYFLREDTVISIFFNVTEQENPHYNLTENIQIAQHNSWEKHLRCKAGKNKKMVQEVPINIDQLMQVCMDLHPRVFDQRHHLLIRMEPQNYGWRYVEMACFKISLSENRYECLLMKQKVEMKNNVFYLYDIFGLENIKKFKYDKDSPIYCNICLDKNIQVIILPCRHMCICYDCAKLFHQRNEQNKHIMKPECPICRKPIKSFINIQGLQFE